MRLVTTAACLLGITIVASDARSAEPPIGFVDEAEARGVADIAVNSTGPAFGDYDNDGDVDIFVPVEDLAEGLQDRLFENDGTGRFREVAAARGVANPGSFSRGAAWGDYDNDGDLDLVVSNMPPGGPRQRHVPTTLFRNQLKETGEPNFVDVTREAGLLRAGNAEDDKIGGIGDTGAGVAWGDYDGDGHLDLFWKNADGEIENALFRNNRDGTFTDVTASSGVAVQEKTPESNAQGAPNWTDVDQDGRLDLIVTNEGAPKFVLRNKGDGTFEDITRNRKPPSAFPFINPGNAQGACLGDIDNDGDLDVYLPLADQANRLFISLLKETGELSYEDITLASGAGDMGGARGCVMADFDNDGFIDIYVNNGGPSNVLINDVIKGFPPFVQFYIAWQPARNTLLRNNGDRTFTDVTEGSGAEGFGIGSGVGAADVNGDGFMDLFVTNRTYYALGKRVSEPGRNFLFINRGNDNGWIKVALEGRRSNRNGYGALVRVVAGDLVQTAESTSAHGYNSTNDPVLHFGLGARTAVDAIEVRWPSGAVQTVKRPKIRRTVRIVEPGS
jgi:hypothetical protein